MITSTVLGGRMRLKRMLKPWANARALPLRIGVFALGVVIFTGMTLLAVVKSKRVTDLLEALSDESLSKKDRRRALRDVLRRSGGQ